jgi:ribose transport system substrate-binding protein
MLRGAYLMLAAAVCLGLAGCGAARPAAKYRIAVIPKGTTHDFWKSIHAGAEQAARERGDIRILWEGAAKEDQRHEQQQIVERFTSDGVSAVVLAPCDRHTMVLPVEEALQKSIPVVIIDSGLEPSPAILQSPKYLGYVATNNREGGATAARRLIELLKDKPKANVMLIRYQKGSESTEEREAGFRETIRTAVNIQLRESADEAGATVDSAQQVAERILADNKDIDGVFLPNESSSTGFLRALEVLNRVGSLKFVGFDSSPLLIDALRAGKLDGLVLQDPFDMGYQGVLRAVGFLEGKPAPAEKTKYTNLKLATRENLEDPVIKTLYARDLTVYLGK